MLTVTFDPKRKPEDGQYFVRLTAWVPDNLGDVAIANQLGYWCDRQHLRHVAAAVLRHFPDELVAAVLK